MTEAAGPRWTVRLRRAALNNAAGRNTVKRALRLAPILAVPILAGCAVMNTSVLETAETLDPGHVKLGAEYTMGLDLTSTVFLEDDTSGTFTADGLLGVECYGIRAGVGLSERLEAGGRLWVAIGGLGSKVYAKYRLPWGGERSGYAVVPAFTYVSSDSDDDDDGLDEYIADVTSYGFELPFIATYAFNEHVSVSGVARYSIDFIGIGYPEDSILSDISDDYVLHRVGLLNGWSFEAGVLYLRPEIGVEMASQINGDLGVVPILGLGLGLEF